MGADQGDNEVLEIEEPTSEESSDSDCEYMVGQLKSTEDCLRWIQQIYPFTGNIRPALIEVEHGIRSIPQKQGDIRHYVQQN